MTEELLVKTLLDARPRVVAGAFAVVRDGHLAEDVFQEVLLRALRMRESFSDAGGVLAWARVSARNLGIDHVRRSGRMGEMLSELALDALDARLEEIGDAQRQRAGARARSWRGCFGAVRRRFTRRCRGCIRRCGSASMNGWRRRARYEHD